MENPLASARMALAARNLSEAERLTRLFVSSHLDSADGHYLLGFILFQERNPKASLAEYTEAARYRRPQVADLLVVGSDYVLLADYADADKWFTQALAWEPENELTLYYLGRTKYNENLFDEAVGLFTRCLKLSPKNVKAEDNLGLAYAGLGKAEEASAAYRKAIAWDAASVSKNSDPYINLGILLMETNLPEQAIPYLLQAVEISPGEMRAHRELGKAYKYVNQFEKAQTELEKAVELAPGNAPLHFMLAQVYRKRGLADKALTETEKYTALTGAP